MAVTSKNSITAFNPASVQFTQRTGTATVGVATNPLRGANVAAIKYERAPMQGESVPVTDKNGQPLLPGYMPCGMVCDYLA